MALTFTQKTSIRRHLNYPVTGLIRTGAPGGGTLASGFVGYRYFQAWGQLEYKMNNLNPDEEARLLGLAMAAVAFVGNGPNPGDTVTVTLSGGAIASPQALVATFPNPAPPSDGKLWLANQLALLAQANTVLQAAGVQGVAPYGTGPFAQAAVPLPEVAFVAPASFTMATAFTGACAPMVTATGAQVPPTTTLDGVTTVWGYLPIADALEGAWLSTSQNLDTIKADVWKGRSNEAGQRRSLYEQWKQQMSDFLGVPLNIDARQAPKRSGAVNYA